MAATPPRRGRGTRVKQRDRIPDADSALLRTRYWPDPTGEGPASVPMTSSNGGAFSSSRRYELPLSFRAVTRVTFGLTRSVMEQQHGLLTGLVAAVKTGRRGGPVIVSRRDSEPAAGRGVSLLFDASQRRVPAVHYHVRRPMRGTAWMRAGMTRRAADLDLNRASASMVGLWPSHRNS